MDEHLNNPSNSPSDPPSGAPVNDPVRAARAALEKALADAEAALSRAEAVMGKQRTVTPVQKPAAPVQSAPAMPQTTAPAIPAAPVQSAPAMPQTAAPVNPAAPVQTAPAMPQTTAPSIPAAPVQTAPAMPQMTAPAIPAAPVQTAPAMPQTAAPVIPAAPVQTAPAPAVTAPPQTETTAQTVSRRPWEPDTTETKAALHLAAQEEEPYTAKDFFNDALDLVGSVLTSVFVVLLVFTYLLRVADVEGDSMVPTLQDGNKLLVARVGRDYETGDILILNSRESYTFGQDGSLKQGNGLGKQIVKRLIAQGGQEVRIDFSEGVVYVDGQALDEPYVNTLTTRDEGGFTYPFTVPEGYVFVLGDNRYISKDSRHRDVGLIPEKDITGRVILRILPFSGFGKVG